MIDVGFKNYIDDSQILTIIDNNSSKAKWFIKEALISNKLINCTEGKKAGCIIILKTNHIIISSLKTNIIKNKLNK